jgi:hypothetical protein
MSKRFGLAVLVLVSSLLNPTAKAGTITGDIKNLDGTLFLNPREFKSLVTTRNGATITSNAVTSGSRYTVTFAEGQLPANDKLINVRLSEANSDDVTLNGLDGTTPTFTINIIMPEKQKIEICPPPCCDYSSHCERPRLFGRLFRRCR